MGRFIDLSSGDGEATISNPLQIGSSGFVGFDETSQYMYLSSLQDTQQVKLYQNGRMYLNTEIVKTMRTNYNWGSYYMYYPNDYFRYSILHEGVSTINNGREQFIIFAPNYKVKPIGIQFPSLSEDQIEEVLSNLKYYVTDDGTNTLLNINRNDSLADIDFVLVAVGGTPV